MAARRVGAAALLLLPVAAAAVAALVDGGCSTGQSLCALLERDTEGSDAAATVSLLQLSSQQHVAAGSAERAGAVAGASAATSTRTLAMAASDVSAKLLPILVAGVLSAALAVPTIKSFPEQSCCLAEFVGTFAVVFTASCCAMVGSPAWGALAVASVLMAMTYATGNVSGGNLNPAVSLSLGMAGALEWKAVRLYWTAQFSGGFAAAALSSALLSPRGVALAPVAPFTGCHAVIVEVIYTCMLCFVVLNCAASKRNNSPSDGNQFYALAIGFVVVAGGYAGGGISGAVFNPAIAMSLDIKHLGFGWGIWYALYEMIGGVVAVALYRAVRPDEQAEQQAGEEAEPRIASRMSMRVSEFLGTFVVAVTVCLNLVSGSVATALSAGAALMCMVYALGDVSGAHFNPAVSFACALMRATEWRVSLDFIAFQILAGISAGVVAATMHTAAASKRITFDVRPLNGYGFTAAAVAELLFTVVLVYTVLATTLAPRPAQQVSRQRFYVGLCIGGCMTLGGVAIGAVSGGELNPAVSCAISTLAGMSPGADPLSPRTYLIGFAAMQLAGSLLAAMLFRTTHPQHRRAGEAAEFEALVSECWGTFVVVLTATCCSLVGGVWTSTAVAFAIMAMVYATAPTSGGHLNPAVSFAMGLIGLQPWMQVYKYCLAQLLGAALAAGTASMLLAPRQLSLAHVDAFSFSHAILAEVLFTSMLCFVYLSCVASQRNNPLSDGNQFFGLAIGFVAIAGGHAAGGVSGACLNPALAMGMDIRRLGLGWGVPWAVAELVGASIGAFLYEVARPDEWALLRGSQADFAGYVPSQARRCFCEFIGTFMLVLTVALNVATSSVATAWSAGAALMCMIYSLGGISGGHFNPAVTLAVLVSGRGAILPKDSGLYMGSQLLGGLAAGAVGALFRSAAPGNLAALKVAPAAGHTLLSAGCAELFFTFVLVYTFLAVATTRPPASQLSKHSFHAALAIGACVTAGGFAAGGVSGGELNPAVAAGLAVDSLVESAASLVTLVMWELTGALLAGVVFRATHASEFSAAPVQK